MSTWKQPCPDTYYDPKITSFVLTDPTEDELNDYLLPGDTVTVQKNRNRFTIHEGVLDEDMEINRISLNNVKEIKFTPHVPDSKTSEHKLVILEKLYKKRMTYLAYRYQTRLQQKVENAIKHEIKCLLTVGRKDEGLKPYSTRFIDKFITKQEKNIKKAVKLMCEEMIQDEGSNTLTDVFENDWCREAMYEYISFVFAFPLCE